MQMQLMLRTEQVSRCRPVKLEIKFEHQIQLEGIFHIAFYIKFYLPKKITEERKQHRYDRQPVGMKSICCVMVSEIIRFRTYRLLCKPDSSLQMP